MMPPEDGLGEFSGGMSRSRGVTTISTPWLAAMVLLSRKVRRSRLAM
ncbi:MAG TPA: hypothetical protein VIM00_12130 [Candidatus Acidoferrum sp.]